MSTNFCFFVASSVRVWGNLVARERQNAGSQDLVDQEYQLSTEMLYDGWRQAGLLDKWLDEEKTLREHYPHIQMISKRFPYIGRRNNALENDVLPAWIIASCDYILWADIMLYDDAHLGSILTHPGDWIVFQSDAVVRADKNHMRASILHRTEQGFEYLECMLNHADPTRPCITPYNRRGNRKAFWPKRVHRLEVDRQLGIPRQ